ncbi:SRPBCC family protein [Yoonia sp. 2307UL14-13]|uniref:SRPBCC family protein n=1 Tax=Yoonia sp. 2307UL14-13 TaxID=3126506 RepID=UPI0030995F99
MPKPVVISHFYQAPPEAVWQVATDFACFAEAMRGVATFEGMPTEGRLKAGDRFDVRVRLFGWMPPMNYYMTLAAYDPALRCFRSIEHGGSIRRWEHVLQVVPENEGARLTDTVHIDAGLTTPLMRVWARYVYRKRHPPRLRMLQSRQPV